MRARRGDVSGAPLAESSHEHPDLTPEGALRVGQAMAFARESAPKPAISAAARSAASARLAAARRAESAFTPGGLCQLIGLDGIGGCGLHDHELGDPVAGLDLECFGLVRVQ